MQIIIKFDFVVSLLHPVCMLPLECDGKHCPRWSLLYTMMFPVALLVCVSWATRCFDWTVYVSVTETRFQPLWPAHTHTHSHATAPGFSFLMFPSKLFIRQQQLLPHSQSQMWNEKAPESTALHNTPNSAFNTETLHVAVWQPQD